MDGHRVPALRAGVMQAVEALRLPLVFVRAHADVTLSDTV